MTREEYIKQFEPIGIWSTPEWSEPKYTCPKCGEGGMQRHDNFVCASNPPHYEYRCNKCGYTEYLLH